MSQRDTWLLTFSIAPCTPDELDTICCTLIENGAAGTHIDARGSIGAFLEATEDEARQFGNAHCVPPLLSVEQEVVKETNWVQKCSDILSDVAAGPITIRPIISSSDMPSLREPNSIYLIPGLGFGTGHHETTRAACTFLSHPFVKQSHPRKVLDVGTGSGILAIASAILYDCTVDAFDTDQMAVENAIENGGLNECEKRINFRCGVIDDYSGAYDLLTANIYAEVLVEMENSLRARLSPGRPLIISGIMQSRLPLIEEAYRSEHWELIDELLENGWATRLFKRV